METWCKLGTFTVLGGFEGTIMAKNSAFSDTLPHRLLLDQLADKWTILVLSAVCDGPIRFNEVKRRVVGVSQKTLTQCLRKLERNGLVGRNILPSAPLGVEYMVTPLGRTLSKPYEALCEWTTTYMPEIAKAQKRFDKFAKRDPGNKMQS
jgi:DNA-binding HxlR family transcriptional regulator